MDLECCTTSNKDNETMSKTMDEISNSDEHGIIAPTSNKLEIKTHTSDHVNGVSKKTQSRHSDFQGAGSSSNIRRISNHRDGSKTKSEFKQVMPKPQIADKDLVNKNIPNAQSCVNYPTEISPQAIANNQLAGDSLLHINGASNIAKELDSSELRTAVLEDMQPEDIKVHRLSKMPGEAWELLKKDIERVPIQALSYKTEQPENTLRFVCLSDTHSRVESRLDERDFTKSVPEGDVLLHAGDFTGHGQVDECIAFNRFLGKLPHPVKIIIPGNHETLLDPELPGLSHFILRKELKLSLNPAHFNDEAEIPQIRKLISNATILIDELIELCGIKIYGTPWVPGYGYPGFGCNRGRQLLEKYKIIPNGIDILISHGPPLGFGDKTSSGRHVGCVELLNCIRHRIKPKYVISGHIHEGHGICSDGMTTYINASICTKGYKPAQKPIIFDLPLPEPYTRQDFIKLIESDSIPSQQDIGYS